jgi:uncharacterized protein YpuA (DUF1002 family)
MTTLESLYRQIQKEKARIEILKNTSGLDVDFVRDEIKEAKTKIESLKKQFDAEYNFQQS